MADNIPNISQEDINANKGISVLSYLGFLCLIPLLAKKESAYAQYHAKQGLTLFIIEVVVSILSWIFAFVLPFLTFVTSILSLICCIFAIIGIVNSATGKVKPLPLIGAISIMK